jgi:hypothetical protein
MGTGTHHHGGTGLLSGLVIHCFVRSYTRQSDVYQIGVMLQSVADLSPAGTGFAQVLKSKTMSAREALGNPYIEDL